MGSRPGGSGCPDEPGGADVEGLFALLPVRLPRFRRLGPVRGRGRRTGTRIGIDLIAVAKVERVFAGNRALLEQVFSAEERRYAEAQRRPFLHLAARFAAKEAVLKGLGTGLAAGMSWLDVTTVRGLRGEPRLRVAGETARRLRISGFRRYALSLSHSEDYALAAVLLSP